MLHHLIKQGLYSVRSLLHLLRTDGIKDFGTYGVCDVVTVCDLQLGSRSISYLHASDRLKYYHM